MTKKLEPLGINASALNIHHDASKSQKPTKLRGNELKGVWRDRKENNNNDIID